jgi:hypothetical protein
VTNAKGRSAIEMSHKLNISYRAAYLLLHKIRWYGATIWMRDVLPHGKMLLQPNCRFPIVLR